MQLIRGLTIIIVIYPLIIYMGIPGAAIGVILSVAGMLIIWYPLSQKITKAPWRKYFDTFWPPLFCSLLMAGSIYLVKIFWEPVGETLAISILTFSMIVIMSIFIYLAALFFLQKIYPAYDVFNEAKFLYKSLMRR